MDAKLVKLTGSCSCSLGGVGLSDVAIDEHGLDGATAVHVYVPVATRRLVQELVRLARLQEPRREAQLKRKHPLTLTFSLMEYCRNILNDFLFSAHI